MPWGNQDWRVSGSSVYQSRKVEGFQAARYTRSPKSPSNDVWDSRRTAPNKPPRRVSEGRSEHAHAEAQGALCNG